MDGDAIPSASLECEHLSSVGQHPARQALGCYYRHAVARKWVVGVGCAITVLAGQFAHDVTPVVATAESCANGATAEELDALFAEPVAGLAGADYSRVIELPDGRALWLFQDGFLGGDDDLRDDVFAHNVGLLQDGECFTRLPAGGGSGTSLIGSWVEQNLNDWVWALDGEVGADGDLWVFVAEVRNANGLGAATGAAPVGTWLARFDLPSMRLVDFAPAPDASNELFGYSVVSDDEWTYLYGHCYKQFGPTEIIGFDPECSPYAYLARIPKGQFEIQPEYWTTEGWSDDRSLLAPVLTADTSMPVSVERFGSVYVAVSDEGDWFGDDVIVRTAPAPQGPWTEQVRYRPEKRCEECNNYGAEVLPWLDGDDILVAQSNNSWDMSQSLADANRYRIDVRAVSVPGITAAAAGQPPSSVPPSSIPPSSDPATTTPSTVTDDTAAATTEAPARSDGTASWVAIVLGGAVAAAIAWGVLAVSRAPRTDDQRPRRHRSGRGGS